MVGVQINSGWDGGMKTSRIFQRICSHPLCSDINSTVVSGHLDVGMDFLLNQPNVNFSKKEQLDLFFLDP
jgi:hypothetical protein